MKKFLFLLIITIMLFFATYAFLNTEVSIQQGVNYQWHTVKMPLYLKILNFLDRHYNYKQLVKDIIKDTRDDEERVLKIFEWTYQYIRKSPAGFPIVDDHVWHIIVRGYGASDQSSDVFTTLCNYAGIDAFFSWVYESGGGKRRIPLSFVRLNGRWVIFDPYNGNYFKDSTGNLAEMEELRSREDWKLYSLKETIDPQEEAKQYTQFFTNLPVIEHLELTRANIQSPFNRLLFQIKSFLNEHFH